MVTISSAYLNKALGLVFFLLWGWNSYAQEAQLEVQLKDLYKGEDLVGVRLTIHETEQFSFSDSSGSIRMTLLPGHYHLHFEKEGYLAEERDLHFPEEKSLILAMIPSRIELDELLIEDGMLNQSRKKYSQEMLILHPKEEEQASQIDLASILERMPGINALNTGQGISKPVIRGFMGNRVAVIDQGIKQEGQQWGLDHGLEIDPFQVQGMELIKGPAALQYGSDALAGALRILAEDLPEKTWSGGLQSVYHSNNQAWGNSVHTAYRKDKLSTSLRLSRKRYSDFKVPAENFTYNGYILPITDNTLKNTAGEQQSAQWNINWNSNQYRARYSFSVYDQKQGMYPGATGIPRGFDVGNIGETRNIDLPRQEIQHYKAYTLQNIKIQDHWLEIEAGYQFNDRAEKSLPHAHGFAELDSNDNLALGLKLHSLQANARYRFHWLEQDFVAGIAQQYQRNHQSGFEFLIPEYGAYQSGLYVLTKGKFQSNLFWDGGLRWEYRQHQSPQGITRWWNNIDSLVLRSPAIDRQFSNLAAAFGLSYILRESWQFKLHLARSFRAPNIAELSSNGVHHGTFRHEVGDAHLNPEIAWQVDGLVEYQNEEWLIRLSPYFYYFENMLFLRPTAQFSNLPEAGQLYEYQQAPALQGGAELYWDWHPWKQLHWSNASELLLNRNLNTQLPLPFSPPWSNLSTLKWEASSWYLSADWRYTFAQDRTDRNEKASPAYHLFGLQAAYKLKWADQQLQIHIAVHNLFDTFYLRHLSRYRILNLPEQGRNVVAGISYSF
tara:strand:+ start:2067 stop:4403 length:2337 start_codon:yes stop_codon:yes gene_type:complete